MIHILFHCTLVFQVELVDGLSWDSDFDSWWRRQDSEFATKSLSVGGEARQRNEER
jgi:hypothetical protein